MALVLRSKTTKVLVSRTLECVPGAAEFTNPRIKDGKVETDPLDFEYATGSVLWWDDQYTQRNEKGERLFVDDHGTTVPESDLEFVSEEEHDHDQNG